MKRKGLLLLLALFMTVTVFYQLQSAESSAAKIAILPPLQEGEAYFYAESKGIMKKAKVITPLELIDKKAFNAKKYPVALYMAGEYYNATVKKKGDGVEAIMNYLKEGGMIVFLPNQPWPMYNELEDGDETGLKNIMFPNLEFNLMGVEEPEESVKMVLNQEQKILPGLPKNMAFPTDGDLRLRALDPDSISENINLTSILTVEEYGDLIGYIEYTDGPFKGGKILYVWFRLLDQDYSEKILNEVFKFVDKHAK